MARKNAKERKCFTFIWEMENASYFLSKKNEWISSPSFVVDEIEGTKWALCLFSYYKNTLQVNNIAFCLYRYSDSNGAEPIGVEWQFALLAPDGAVLSSSHRRKEDFRRGFFIRNDVIFDDPTDVLAKRKSKFLPQDTLTVSCKIWKSVGQMSGDIHRFVRTCRAEQKKLFLWKVGHFRALESEKKYTYEIKSLDTGEQLISLGLLLNAGLSSDEIRITLTRVNSNVMSGILEICPVDALGNTVECLKDEILFGAFSNKREFSLILSKSKLMDKSGFLSFLCKCSFSTLIVKEAEGVISDSIIFENSAMKNLCFDREKEVKRAICDGITIENSERKNRCLDRENVLPIRKNVLINDFKSMLIERIQSDIQLRTRTKTYPAHKCILCARSPVFKAMFSNDMKEKINESVDIEDLNDDTVFRMLQYIYSADVEELEWRSAIQLYEASDKYEILTLRDECSCYLKNNLCRSNACEALVLANLHQDEGLKCFVQDFIVRQGKDIVFSKEWEQLMETNPKLAAETMRLKYKE